MLDGSLIIATMFTIFSATLIICMFWNMHWRFTNVIMLIPGLICMFSMGVWYYLSGAYKEAM